MCKEEGWTTKVEASSVAIGRRYCRMDEIGVSLGLTVDYDTLEDHKVTIRDVNSMKQVRAEINKLTEILRDIIGGRKMFDNLLEL